MPDSPYEKIMGKPPEDRDPYTEQVPAMVKAKKKLQFTPDAPTDVSGMLQNMVWGGPGPSLPQRAWDSAVDLLVPTSPMEMMPVPGAGMVKKVKKATKSPYGNMTKTTEVKAMPTPDLKSEKSKRDIKQSFSMMADESMKDPEDLMSLSLSKKEAREVKNQINTLVDNVYENVKPAETIKDDWEFLKWVETTRNGKKDKYLEEELYDHDSFDDYWFGTQFGNDYINAHFLENVGDQMASKNKNIQAYFDEANQSTLDAPGLYNEIAQDASDILWNRWEQVTKRNNVNEIKKSWEAGKKAYEAAKKKKK